MKVVDEWSEDFFIAAEWYRISYIVWIPYLWLWSQFGQMSLGIWLNATKGMVWAVKGFYNKHMWLHQHSMGLTTTAPIMIA